MKSVLVLGVLAVFVDSLRYDLGDRLQNYNKNAPPPGPVEVQIGIQAWKFRINKKNELEGSFYFRHRWLDERLAGLDEEVRLYGDEFKTIWRPDLFLRDSTLKVKDNGVNVLQVTKVNTTGHVWHVLDVDGNIPCKPGGYFENGVQIFYMNGTIVCRLIVESFSYTTDQLSLNWLPSPVEFSDRMEMEFSDRVEIIPQNYKNSWTLDNCTQRSQVSETGYPCLAIKLSFDLLSSASARIQAPSVFLALIVPLTYFIYIV